MKIIKTTDIRKGVRLIMAAFISVAMFLSFLTIAEECSAKSDEKKEDIKHISFSHDGKKILFNRVKGKERNSIHVYNLETGELSAYQSPADEVWAMARYSYDGKHVAFIIMPLKDKYLDLKNMQIAVMDPNGKNVRRITNSPGTRIFPSFSHDGKKIIFARAAEVRKSGKTPAADYDVYEADVKTGKETRLTWFKFFQMSSPYYFPDAKTFIFSAASPRAFPGIPDKDYDTITKKRKEVESKWGNGPNIYVMQKGEEQLLSPYIYGDVTKLRTNMEKQLGAGATKPLITATGKQIFFLTQAYKPDGSGDGYQFFEYSPDGKHRRITNLKSLTVWAAAISPDGKFLGIAYEGRENYPARGKHRIVIYKVKDGTSREISLPDKPLRIINQASVSDKQ